VVAIIAILAAIAVPNFLEAQVRAKVARVKEEMHALATAIEAYTADYNREPISIRENDYGPVNFGWGGIWGQWNPYEFQLTTPVAYLTSIPRDPFRINTFLEGADGASGGWSSRPMNTPYEYDNYTWQKPANPSEVIAVIQARNYKWSLFSAGPSRRWNFYEGDILAGRYTGGAPGPYDPSNGTASWGPIMRTNQGALDYLPPSSD